MSIDARKNIRSKVSGFTLIEVLVSMLILSIGVLGVTALQLSGLEANRGALMRIEANQHLRDLADRIDVNPGTSYGPIALGDAPATAVNCSGNVCTPAEMAVYDTSYWLCSINSRDTSGSTHSACTTLDIFGSLPRGKASIALASGEYTIRIEWQGPRSNRVAFVELVMKEAS